jgi:hypothetical protein
VRDLPFAFPDALPMFSSHALPGKSYRDDARREHNSRASLNIKSDYRVSRAEKERPNFTALPIITTPKRNTLITKLSRNSPFTFKRSMKQGIHKIQPLNEQLSTFMSSFQNGKPI